MLKRLLLGCSIAVHPKGTKVSEAEERRDVKVSIEKEPCVFSLSLSLSRSQRLKLRHSQPTLLRPFFFLSFLSLSLSLSLPLSVEYCLKVVI
jgi:hypothetical protein